MSVPRTIYTCPPDAWSKPRAVTPGVTSRKSEKSLRLVSGRLRCNSPEMFTVFDELSVSSIGTSATTVIVSPSAPIESATSTVRVRPAVMTTPPRSCRAKPCSSAVRV